MILFLFVLGTVVGSFLNVVGLRWDSKHFGGRSRCPSCAKTLRWFELVPVLSFLVQRGRCRNCDTKVSYQYPIIEILTGLIFATVSIWMLPVFCIYIVILIYDFHHKIIPDELVYVSIVLAIITSYFFSSTSFSTFDWLAGPILFLFFGSIWFLSRGRAMGFGDAKLALSVGLLLGASAGFSAIVLAFWMGAGVSLCCIFLNKTGFIKNDKGLTMKSEIPFAPFIILGTWLSLVFHFNIFYVSLF